MSNSYNGLDVFEFQFDRFGYEHPWIGEPTGEFMLGPNGGGMMEFAKATVFALPDGGAHEVHGEILDWYMAHGGPYGPLGYPISNEKPTPTGYGRYSLFERGSIGWLPETGAFAIGTPEDDSMNSASEADETESIDLSSSAVSISA
ncbi:hypothetical protein DK926_00290 [Rhodococcus sp. Eu-32]|uniref:LGFP repeat-containing protein n=1 Tax=Rhodococcus sp. Eu-32 TaxID=1017319 RepID=UPI000DF15B6C|nr:hypothetical protein [Rhodococcus sp. Eu-32]RRQ29359.1 hypothetical protein DK926_00290 [Rhodococcus sp. Eu-32]